MRSCSRPLFHRFATVSWPVFRPFANDSFMVTRAVMELRNTCGEVEALKEAVKVNRHGHRD
jgi:hypothetical protein